VARAQLDLGGRARAQLEKNRITISELIQFRTDGAEPPRRVSHRGLRASLGGRDHLLERGRKTIERDRARRTKKLPAAKPASTSVGQW